MKLETREITFKVFRFNIETDSEPRYESYTLEVIQSELVLDILNRIKWEKDGSFSYRRSCRHGICGACAVKVNSRSIIACKTNVLELANLFGDELIIEPSNISKAIKDLIIDKQDFWEKYNVVKPYLITDKEIEAYPKKENLISAEVAEEVDEADHCIQCGVCYYACPAVEVNEKYIGPAGLAKAFRFNFDVRDNAKRERLETLNDIGPGIWDCVKCFECAEACPKDVNPIKKITALHTQTFEEEMARDNVAVKHAVGFKHSIKKHGFLDEGELVRYSEGNIGVIKHIPEAIGMFKKGKIVMPWNMPKSKNLDEIKKLVESCSSAKFKGE